MLDGQCLGEGPVDPVDATLCEDVPGQWLVVRDHALFERDPVLDRPVEVADRDQAARDAVRPEIGVMVIADDDDGIGPKLDQARCDVLERLEYGVFLRLVRQALQHTRKRRVMRHQETAHYFSHDPIPSSYPFECWCGGAQPQAGAR
ncbi:hypothetical protein NSU_4943 [Novosphingobium pentaromativorans US6-1]|uniref:Uncharacterized protein n=1 Tax=Novosphingobium pentaromativorans US6-1 TaxID=1088721 RepID=G6EKS2_9SPHN|nr:hypothetical protein NSU_4943 [Novosphingobium pentaromativorans US6-1]